MAPKTSLEEILKYRHDQVIKRFAKDYPDMADRSEVIFEDLMRFFWASKRHNEDKQREPNNPHYDFMYIMDEEMKSIDQMWHVFLLYTKDYALFCEKYFGEFLHHLPDLVDPSDNDIKFFTTNLEKFLSYSYDLYGEDIIKRWYQPIFKS